MLFQTIAQFFVANACSTQVFFNPKYAKNVNTSIAIPVNISCLYNNRAFAARPNDADMDGSGSGYPSSYMPPSSFIYSGINFNFPTYKKSGNDSIRASGETILVPSAKYFSTHLLVAAESGSLVEGYLNATYADGSTDSSPILVPVWWYNYLFGGDIIFPFYYSKYGVDFNKSMIHLVSSKLDSSKDLVSLTLPDVSTGIHVFSMSIWPSSNTKSSDIAVERARSTQKWIGDDEKTQIVEVIINNVGFEWIQGDNYLHVSIESAGYKTVEPVIIKRLKPGDQVIVNVGVVSAGEAGITGKATVVIYGKNTHVTYDFEATFGIVPYEASFGSVYSHESPEWFDNAKYGIFIHWGLYSIPAWGNSGENETYAEWYWWNMNAGPDTTDRTWEFNLDHYGPYHEYDEFMNEFTASAWDPREWVDLFADSGANYFVQTTKHHDGYALFDVSANATLRTSVAQPPYRNFLLELFDAADQYQPQLHKGTYFSLPEWFNPAYGPYGRERCPGKNATNPYTNQTLPYTGFVEVEDFLQDLMLPQMKSLAAMGTDIIWCDLGGANVSVEFAAPWFNTALSQNRQVVMNNRCGIPGDFDTPEYTTLKLPQARKWESNLGMDPYSYGYNRATTTSSYMNASSIVTTLVDIISKNGNLLLDIGPTGNGSIVVAEKENLLEAGIWIRSHGEAIYNTSYWFVTPGEGDSVRFTQTLDAFYIFLLEEPTETIMINSPVPYLAGDQITTIGGSLAGTAVTSKLLANGSLEIKVPKAIIAADKWTWVFKITF
ncbi:alpha-L-fucosidase [Coleophoma crateriformis]|uniref:alpha-L-fucosidase n=1 Tax=Coleophoma crateriformis TaxID=565419 RepID=A0A3D8RE32_9HELO|nr:alpha-L-fucosidase [Coleophoma crateriformis]